MSESTRCGFGREIILLFTDFYFTSHYFSNMLYHFLPPVLKYAVSSALIALSSYGNPTYSLRSNSNAVSSVKHFLSALPELIISI